MRCCKRNAEFKLYLDNTDIFSVHTALICRLLNTLHTEESGALTMYRSGRWNSGNDF